MLLAEGDAHAAAPVLRGAWASFEELGVPYEAARVRVLPAHVEIMLATKDVGAARAGADELSGIAEQMGMPYVIMRTWLGWVPKPASRRNCCASGRPHMVYRLFRAG